MLNHSIPHRLTAIGAACAMLAATGCTAVDPRTGQADAMPLAPPARAATPYTEALYCVDNLMAQQARPKQRPAIAVGAMPDATGRVSPGLRDMVTTALVRGTRESQAFFPTEVLTLSQTPLGVAGSSQQSGSIITASAMPNYPGSLQVIGALTQADRNVASQNSQGGVGFMQNLFGISMNSDISNVGIDLRLVDVDKRVIKQSVSNQMTVRSRSRGANADFKIGNFGLNFEVAFDDREGLHQAVRTLVELAVVELLGMQTEVPYWHCLQLNRRNGGVQRQIAAWYRGMSPPEVGDYVRRRLQTVGYVIAAGQDSIRNEIADFQRNQKLIPDGNVNFETFAALMDAEQVGAMPQGVLPKPPPSPEPYGPRRVQLDVLQIAYPKPLLQLSVGLDRAGGVACWHRDEDGAVSRILPNRYLPAAMQSADAPVLIPPNPRTDRPVIQPERMTPQVGFLCAAGGQDWSAVLPPGLWGDDLAPLPGVDFAKLEQGIRAAGGTDVTITQTSDGRRTGQWSVIPPTAR